jgi:hypothetical protein
MLSTAMRFLKGFLTTFAVLVGLFGLMQLVPYGRDHSNPPVTRANTTSKTAARR